MSEQLGLRMSLLYNKCQDLFEEYELCLREEFELPQEGEERDDWYEQAINYWCRQIAEIAVNSGCQDFLTTALRDCESEVDAMGMMFDSAEESPFL